MRHFEIIDNYTASAKLDKSTPLVIAYNITKRSNTASAKQIAYNITKRSNYVSIELVKNLGMNTICQLYYISKSTGEYVEHRGKDAKRGTFIKAGDKFFLEHDEPCFYI